MIIKMENLFLCDLMEESIIQALHGMAYKNWKGLYKNLEFYSINFKKGLSSSWEFFPKTKILFRPGATYTGKQHTSIQGDACYGDAGLEILD